MKPIIEENNFDDVTVKTKYGTIIGIRQIFNKTKINVYLGVPFAQQPVGKLRFGIPKPLPIPGWDGILIADKHTSTCILTPDKMFPQFPGAEMWNPTNSLDEKCLALNIWIPQNHDGKVMVWIYGGGFFSGSPSLDLYDGRVLAEKEKAIIVNINYRLGPFGFLYFGPNTKVPGNMGLLDQQMALKWVYENIGDFGGNPNKITLLGESAGAASATSHLFAPDSEKYFNKIIVNSGTITNSWATKSKEISLKISLQLAIRMNCTDGLGLSESEIILNNINNVIQCLYMASPYIIQQESDIITLGMPVPMTFPFTPVEEDVNFFKGNIHEKLAKNDFKKNVSVIIGSVKDEGTYWLPYFLYHEKHGLKFNHTISSDDIENQALISDDQYRNSFKEFSPYFGDSPLINHALIDAYSFASTSNNDKERKRDGIARFVGDFFFTCSLIDFADKLSDNIYGPIFMYYFTKRSTANPWPKWMGAMHGYEIEYIFGMPFRRPELYKKDALDMEQKFSLQIMKLWSTFANDGKVYDSWSRYNKVTREAIVLDDFISQNRSPKKIRDIHGHFCKLIDEAKVLSMSTMKRNPYLATADYKIRQKFNEISSSTSKLLPSVLLLIIGIILKSSQQFIF
ncbi:Acetylcholinesterase [Strongyloides ratti]|uniref:Carboxylic ester hydrolase n=1 Tax=Strongyloides ratti TaxID=34506 RepID=A0A090MWZ6_STRRB|nr:Acetylcholinesterase [Strongyloides ratti]CEF64549.1 Acetylcholinesterase [Strongyloides ratti]